MLYNDTVCRYINVSVKAERGIEIPYADDPKYAALFHRDAIVLAVMSKMESGESVRLPDGISYSDVSKLLPFAYPQVFTAYDECDSGSGPSQIRIWRVK